MSDRRESGNIGENVENERAENSSRAEEENQIQIPENPATIGKVCESFVSVLAPPTRQQQHQHDEEEREAEGKGRSRELLNGTGQTISISSTSITPIPTTQHLHLNFSGACLPPEALPEPCNSPWAGSMVHLIPLPTQVDTQDIHVSSEDISVAINNEQRQAHHHQTQNISNARNRFESSPGSGPGPGPTEQPITYSASTATANQNQSQTSHSMPHISSVLSQTNLNIPRDAGAVSADVLNLATPPSTLIGQNQNGTPQQQQQQQQQNPKTMTVNLTEAQVENELEASDDVKTMRLRRLNNAVDQLEELDEILEPEPSGRSGEDSSNNNNDNDNEAENELDASESNDSLHVNVNERDLLTDVDGGDDAANAADEVLSSSSSSTESADGRGDVADVGSDMSIILLDDDVEDEGDEGNLANENSANADVDEAVNLDSTLSRFTFHVHPSESVNLGGKYGNLTLLLRPRPPSGHRYVISTNELKSRSRGGKESRLPSWVPTYAQRLQSILHQFIHEAIAQSSVPDIQSEPEPGTGLGAGAETGTEPVLGLRIGAGAGAGATPAPGPTLDLVYVRLEGNPPMRLFQFDESSDSDDSCIRSINQSTKQKKSCLKISREASVGESRPKNLSWSQHVYIANIPSQYQAADSKGKEESKTKSCPGIYYMGEFSIQDGDSLGLNNMKLRKKYGGRRRGGPRRGVLQLIMKVFRCFRCQSPPPPYVESTTDLHAHPHHPLRPPTQLSPSKRKFRWKNRENHKNNNHPVRLSITNPPSNYSFKFKKSKLRKK